MNTSMPIPAIILAAGASRRLGLPKQLVEFRGETLLGRAIRLALEAGAAPVLVVLGAQAETIRAQLDSHPDVVLVQNHEWQEGIAASIRAGLRAADAQAQNASGVLVMGCDQPRLTSEHLRLVLQTFQQNENAVIVASTYAGIRGVPAVFPRSVLPLLEALEGDSGARRILMQAACTVFEIAFEGGEIDIDLPSDLRQLE